MYSDREAAALTAAQDAKAAAETQRRAQLRANTSRPLVFLDVEIGGKAVGRMEFALFTHESPRAAENFRALCTCEKGTVPDLPGREGAGKPYCFKVRTALDPRLSKECCTCLCCCRASLCSDLLLVT